MPQLANIADPSRPSLSSTTGVPAISCIPVSWPEGLGELMRMLTLARAAQRRWPDARFHFVVNRHVPERARARIPADFGVTLLNTSPTWDDAGVMAAIDRTHPDLVLFDNAGNGRQCRHAKRSGARTVFVSTRRETRTRGLAVGWLRWLDEHWIVAPTGLDGALTAWDRVKVAVASRPVIRRLQSMFLPSLPERRLRLQRTLECAERPYVCFVPGGGGGTMAGVSSVAVFAEAAARVAATTGTHCVLLQGPLYQGPAVQRAGVTVCQASHEETVDVIDGARLVVLGASSTLFQALAQQKVCVATTSGGSEQLGRARAWAARGVVAAADPYAESLAAAACRLLARADDWEAMHRQVIALGVTNDLLQALAAMDGLLAHRARAAH